MAGEALHHGPVLYRMRPAVAGAAGCGRANSVPCLGFCVAPCRAAMAGAAVLVLSMSPMPGPAVGAGSSLQLAHLESASVECTHCC